MAADKIVTSKIVTRLEKGSELTHKEMDKNLLLLDYKSGKFLFNLGITDDYISFIEVEKEDVVNAINEKGEDQPFLVAFEYSIVYKYASSKGDVSVDEKGLSYFQIVEGEPVLFIKPFDIDVEGAEEVLQFRFDNIENKFVFFIENYNHSIFYVKVSFDYGENFAKLDTFPKLEFSSFSTNEES